MTCSSYLDPPAPPEETPAGRVKSSTSEHDVVLSGRAVISTQVLVETALVSGSGRVFTEDLQHGNRIDGVEVQNPFLREPGRSEP